MLYVAAVLLVLVSLMHSVKGGRYLIEPILANGAAPPILGGISDTRFTLRAGWVTEPPTTTDNDGKAKITIEGPPAEEML